MKDFSVKIFKKVEVVSYNPEWSTLFESEALIIRKALGNECKAIHHIGSTSVPGLCAKPIIDIVVELVEGADLGADKLATIGYKYKGEFNIPMRRFFDKKRPFDVHLHVYETGHPEIELNLKFRDFLRGSKPHRLRYEALKMKLVQDPASHEKVSTFTGYTLGKNKFITEIITLIGFNGVCPRFCAHDTEWDEYHRIRERFFTAKGGKYNKEDSLYSSPEDHHLVLYKGTHIVGASHINTSRENIAEVKFFHVDDLSPNKELVNQFIAFLEKWSTFKNRRLIWGKDK